MIRRRLKVETEITCCRDNDEDIIYHPDKNYEIYEETAERFDISLEEWADINSKALCDQLKEEAENECIGLGTDAYLCEWKCKVIEIEETPVVKVPQDVRDRIERLEGLIADSMKAIEEYEDMIADILAKKEEDRTAEDREKLLRLDGYIRSENESIRKYQFEIKKLKTEWNIE